MSSPLSFSESMIMEYELSEKELYDLIRCGQGPPFAVYDSRTLENKMAVYTIHNYLHSLYLEFPSFDIFLWQFMRSSFHEFLHFILDNFTDVQSESEQHKIIDFLQKRIKLLMDE